MKQKIITKEFFAYLGQGILILMLIYLILKMLGFVQSPSLELVLIGIITGQAFYNGYAFRALKDIDRQLQEIREQLKDHENRLRRTETTLGI